MNETGLWSQVSFEPRPWNANPDIVLPRRYRLLSQQPYEAAVVPRIADIQPIRVSSSTAALIADASNEIIRFDTEGAHHLSPYVALLLRTESAASSKIEHLTASAQSIFLAELGDPTKRNANLIVANTAAMTAALRLAGRLDAQAILDMHQALLGAEHPEWAGRWRDQQVWIGGNDYSPHGAVFVPPHHEHLDGLIADLTSFISREDIPALTLAAIAHAHFETLHPFPDGNGRVGRALIHATLRNKGITTTSTIPVSAGFLTDTETYFASLTAYRAGEHESIIELTAHATFRAINNARTLVEELNALNTESKANITARKDATVWRLLDLLVRQPVVDSNLVVDQLGVAPHNANTALALLEEAGIVKKIAGNHRYRKWAAPEVLHAIDKFARRAGRRLQP